MPGFCYDCLTNPTLPASKRMYQFKNKPKWQTHIQGHVDALDDYKPVKCNLRTSQCLGPFDSVLRLQFHLQDAHGIHTIKRRRWRKRSRHESDEGQAVEQKRQNVKHKRETIKSEEAEDQKWSLEYAFVNSTITSMEPIAACSTSKSSSCRSTPSQSLTTSSYGDRESRTLTPLSSVGDEIPINLGICSQKPLHAGHDDFVVINTMEDGVIRQSDSVSLSDSRSLCINGETAVTTVEYAQISPRCCPRIALPPETDDSAFVDLTGDGDVDCCVPSVIRSEYQNLVDVTSPPNL